MCLTRAPPCSVRYVNSLCGVTLSVVRRRDLQQCSNNISVFIFVRHVFMSSLLIKPIVQHHRSRVSPVLLQRFSSAPVGKPYGKGPHSTRLIHTLLYAMTIHIKIYSIFIVPCIDNTVVCLPMKMPNVLSSTWHSFFSSDGAALCVLTGESVERYY